jgi:type III pantothenate kinase
MAGMPKEHEPSDLIAVDIGNSRIKMGRFRRDSAGGIVVARDGQASDRSSLPAPIATFDLPIDSGSYPLASAQFSDWYNQQSLDEAVWQIASVNRAATAWLTSAIADRAKQARIDWQIRILTYRDIPLATRIDEPERVGIDRLLAALAADRLRAPQRAAIIVDLGTAITVDLLTEDGAFAGGAILPGIAMAARALSEQTDALPQVAAELLDQPPAALGRSTVPAIESGIFWGAVGAIRELVARLSAPLHDRPDIFITGGASARVTELLAKQQSVRQVPNLVLSGIALVKT